MTALKVNRYIMSGIIAWITSFFTKDALGILFKMLFAKSAAPVVRDILDPKNQKIALEFVRELNNDKSLTTGEKAAIFNKMMLNWAKKEGLKMCESAINLLRELAVNAVKAEMEDHGL